MMWNRNFSVYSQEKSCLTFVYEDSDTSHWPLHVNRAFPSSNHSTESSALAFKMMWNRNFNVYSQEKSCLTFAYEASDTANWPLHVNRAFPSSNHWTESSALAFKMMWNRNFNVYSQEKSCLTFREGCTGEYCSEVVAGRTEGQYSPVRLELARLVSSLWYGILISLCFVFASP